MAESTDGNVVGVVWRSSASGGEAVFDASDSGTNQSFAAAGADAWSTKVTGDANDRFVINADGSMEWGSGSATGDVRLRRSAANVLLLDCNGAAATPVLTSDQTNWHLRPSSTGSVGFVNADASDWVIRVQDPNKLAFFGAAPITRPASPGADATDLASVITLANNIKARLVALGLTA